MANTPQQRKRVRIAARQRLENLRYKSSIKTLFKRLKRSIATGDEDEVKAVATKLTSTIDKAAARKAIHKNNAARKKSRVARTLNAR
ncbi:MAG: 30S ribosomal protein S20 [Actinobacteria bacterium ADurb.Bin444]|nr:MAG: 30S ribosomal protein S20 [Actinobacteria bacterium ADurb.Bin444]